MSTEVAPIWWRITYKKPGELACEHWTMKEGTVNEAEEAWKKEHPDAERVRTECWPFDPAKNHTWVPRGYKYPTGAVTIHGSDGIREKITFFPLGGGFERSMGWNNFRRRFRPVSEYDLTHLRFDLEFFCFDDGPTVAAFSSGHTWNGWGCPRIPAELMQRWTDAEKEENGYSAFHLTEEGGLKYQYQDEEEYDHVEAPVAIEYQGKVFHCFDAGLGLCWHHFTLEDIMSGECHLDMVEGAAKALYPEGVDADPIKEQVKFQLSIQQDDAED